jgi:large subunit ribosomal protein L3
MSLGLLGLKVGMTQIYEANGQIAPVTVLKVGPCPVLQVKKKGDKRAGSDRVGQGDGYDAVQVGFVDKARRKAIRAERGHVAADLVSKRRASRTSAGVTPPPKANCEPQRYTREFRLDTPATVAVGAVLTAAEVFKKIKTKDKDNKEIEVYPHVDVTGTSKGRGTTGVIKRHNFGGLRASHGVKKGERQRGSIGSHASNRGDGRPKKGLRMAGRYGAERVTVRNLEIVGVDEANHLLLVRGAVPGPNGGLILVRPTNKHT